MREQELFRGAGSTRYEFINFAVGTYNPEQVLAMIEMRALDIHNLDTRALDTRAAFRAGRQSDYWIHPLDPHPTGRAHEIFAREIASFLDSEGLLPATRGQ